MERSAEYLVVFTTFASRSEAEKLASAVVSKRLASCAQVSGPISSTYWWNGKVERAEEWMCALKTTRKAYPKLEAAIHSLHSYEGPQIIAVPIVAGSNKYLAWIGKEVAKRE